MSTRGTGIGLPAQGQLESSAGIQAIYEIHDLFREVRVFPERFVLPTLTDNSD